MKDQQPFLNSGSTFTAFQLSSSSKPNPGKNNLSSQKN